MALKLFLGIAVTAVLAVLAPGPSTEATGTIDLTGVMCLDLYLDAAPPQTKGQPHGAEDTNRATKIIQRLEPGATASEWKITPLAYSGPGDPIPTKPPSAESCLTKGDGNSLHPQVPPASLDSSAWPTAVGTVSLETGGKALKWDICQFQPNLLGGMWALTHFNLIVDGNTATTDYGLLTAFLDPNLCTSTEADLNFNLVIESVNRVATTGIVDPNADDDWDGDGCSDWNELSTIQNDGGRRDPFNPWDYFNPTQDHLNRVDDIIRVSNMFFIDSGNPLYTDDTDRSFLGLADWNLGPPNGQHRVNDIINSTKQFFHDC